MVPKPAATVSTTKNSIHLRRATASSAKRRRWMAILLPTGISMLPPSGFRDGLKCLLIVGVAEMLDKKSGLGNGRGRRGGRLEP